eukprot:764073-Hanusia_phi.AAC.2
MVVEVEEEADVYSDDYSQVVILSDISQEFRSEYSLRKEVENFRLYLAHSPLPPLGLLHPVSPTITIPLFLLPLLLS